MPCMCYYDPPEESKRYIKYICQHLIDEIHRLEKGGDPLGCSLVDVKNLLDHLYDPGTCEESKTGTAPHPDPGTEEAN